MNTSKLSKHERDLIKKGAELSDKKKAIDIEMNAIKAELIKLGVGKYAGNDNRTVTVYETAPTIIIDSAKVKAAFPDWQERFGQVKAGYTAVKW